jgi:outer membrane protein assembly factor BamD
MTRRRRLLWLQALPFVLAALGLAACEAPKPKFKTPARTLYQEAQRQGDEQLYAEAITKFQQVADENPGTLLGSFAYLQIAELRAQQGDWSKAETNYRLFLAAEPATHLTPYVLYRLAQSNHEQSFSGIFFPTREVDRDQGANRRIIQEYRRFFFLYPHSRFLPEVRKFAAEAGVTLAQHERQVGDFYFDHEHYNAAASRYLYLLRNFPDYPDADAVLQRLIRTYRLNQQPRLADEMERLAKEVGAPPTARQDGAGTNTGSAVSTASDREAAP